MGCFQICFLFTLHLMLPREAARQVETVQLLATEPPIDLCQDQGLRPGLFIFGGEPSHHSLVLVGVALCVPTLPTVGAPGPAFHKNPRLPGRLCFSFRTQCSVGEVPLHTMPQGCPFSLPSRGPLRGMPSCPLLAITAGAPTQESWCRTHSKCSPTRIGRGG